jgi:hypothetical protein
VTTRDYLRWFWRSLIRQRTADATAAALSATQTDAERAQAHGDGSHSSATPQEAQEATQ